jgi:predicted permease
MEMMDVLLRAACFIGIILLGYFLRRINFFKEGDFDVLAKIALKITLPAAIICNINGSEISIGMLGIALIGFGGGVLYLIVMYLLNLRSSREQCAFEMLNSTAYNIGNFTMPFAQSFFGPSGVLVTSIFDTGNAIVCLGGAYSVCAMIKGDDGRISLKPIVKKLISSVPFDTYIIMTLLCLLHISLPAPVVSYAQIIANANAFVAMLMIGVGFRLSGDMSQMKSIVRILVVRYGIALALSLGIYFLLPMPLEYRRILSIIVFAPIASAAPAFTAELKSDVGLSSAINSISILISLTCIVVGILILF